MSKRGSLTSAKSLHEFKHESLESRASTSAIMSAAEKTTTATTTTTVRNSPHKTKDCSAGDEAALSKGRGIRPSKSDASLSDSLTFNLWANVLQNSYSLREGRFCFFIILNIYIYIIYFKVLNGNANWYSDQS